MLKAESFLLKANSHKMSTKGEKLRLQPCIYLQQYKLDEGAANWFTLNSIDILCILVAYQKDGADSFCGVSHVYRSIITNHLREVW